MECTFNDGLRERSDTCWLHEAVEALVVRMKMLVMRTVSGARWIIDCDNKAGFPPSNTTGSLNVLCGGLRLSNYCHQAQARHIQTHLDHVCRQADIDSMLFLAALQRRIKLLQNLGYLIALNPAREFQIPVNEASRLQRIFASEGCSQPLPIPHGVHVLSYVRPYQGRS